MDLKHKQAEEAKLLATLTKELPRLEELWQNVEKFGYERCISKFYSQSYKAFQLQELTQEIVALLQTLAPHRPLHPWFKQILAEGTGKEFSLEVNERWLETTRPIVEAFLHARYFLEMAIKYGRQLKEPPEPLQPFGWGAVLNVFGLD